MIMHFRVTGYNRKLRYEVFSDAEAMPSLGKQFAIFSRALIVVAPHGAGLANVLTSPSGALIVEAQCNTNTFNLCYQDTAMLLGHHYVGLGEEGNECDALLKFNPEAVEEAINYFMHHRAKSE